MSARTPESYLDDRLLNYATGSEVFVTIPEYEQWQRTGKLTHIRSVLVVQDAAAASWQDARRGGSWDTYADWLRKLDLPVPVSI